VNSLQIIHQESKNIHLDKLPSSETKIHIYTPCKTPSTNRKMLLRIERAPSASTYSLAAFSRTPSQPTLGRLVCLECASLCLRAERHFDEIARRSSAEKGRKGTTVETRAISEAWQTLAIRNKILICAYTKNLSQVRSGLLRKHVKRTVIHSLDLLQWPDNLLTPDIRSAKPYSPRNIYCSRECALSEATGLPRYKKWL
jgi:hypothetical protein